MDKLIHILQELHPHLDFYREDALIDGGILDSFDVITIVAEIDDSYGVAIPAEALIPENFNSAAALYELILRLSDN